MGRSRSCSPAKCPIANSSKKPHQDHLALRTDIQQPGRCSAQNTDIDSSESPEGGATENSQGGSPRRQSDEEGIPSSHGNASRVQFQKQNSEDNISTEISTVHPLTEDHHKTGTMVDTTSVMGNKIGTTRSGLVYYLQTVREPVVDYQETRGISRNEDITFVTLITSLCTQAYTAAITILVMLWNLMPLVDGFVYFFRFILDKLIDIAETEDTRERVVKALIFVGELVVTFFLIFLILGLIFMPVYVLLAQLTSKIFSMVAW